MKRLLKVVLVCAAVIVAAVATVRYVAHRSFKHVSKGLEMQKIDDATGLPLVKQVPFYFIRHGETAANKNQIFVGSTDVPLNETGLRQAQLAAERMAGIAVETIVCSKLQRARVTADIIAGHLGKPVLEVEGLEEFHAGEFEGKPYASKLNMIFNLLVRGREAAIFHIFNKLKKRMKEGEIAGAEDYNTYVQRILAAMNKVLALPGPVLIVAHGGVHHVLQEHLGLPFSLIPNATPLLHTPPQSASGAWTVHEH